MLIYIRLLLYLIATLASVGVIFLLLPVRHPYARMQVLSYIAWAFNAVMLAALIIASLLGLSLAFSQSWREAVTTVNALALAAAPIAVAMWWLGYKKNGGGDEL